MAGPPLPYLIHIHKKCGLEMTAYPLPCWGQTPKEGEFKIAHTCCLMRATPTRTEDYGALRLVNPSPNP